MESKLELLRWTRAGVLGFPWHPFETAERLALAPALRERLERVAREFKAGRDDFHSMRLAWRTGAYFFGPAGSGKSAAGRALARMLGWPHLTIPAHEILDSHLFERAMAYAASRREHVVVLEDIDQVAGRMEMDELFTLLDHAMERADGVLWVATTRHAERVPKTQLLRPGRFEETIRLELPPTAIRREILMNEFLVPFFSTLSGDDEQVLAELVEQTDGLSYSHFEEMRQLSARLKLGKRENEFWSEVRAYIQDQLIAGDRYGGLSDVTQEAQERAAHLDPRVLLAAIEMTDVFRKLMEKAIADAAEESKRKQSEQGEQA